MDGVVLVLVLSQEWEEVREAVGVQVERTRITPSAIYMV
jgi:hypothetical protein